MDAALATSIAPRVAAVAQAGTPPWDFWGRVTAWHAAKRTVQEVPSVLCYFGFRFHRSRLRSPTDRLARARWRGATIHGRGC